MDGGYSVCLNKWALDNDIKNELRLLLIISSLCAKKGYCFASNEYLGKIFEENQDTISRKIKKLEKKGYIKIEYEKRGAEIKERKLRLTKMSFDDRQKNQSTIDKNVKDNIISINNISINNNNTDTIFDFLQENGFQLSPIQYEVVKEWEDNELTRYAIKKAVLNNKYNINYIQKILSSYKQNNIKTVQQAIENDEEYQKQRENYYKNKYKPKENYRDRERRLLEDLANEEE